MLKKMQVRETCHMLESKNLSKRRLLILSYKTINLVKIWIQIKTIVEDSLQSTIKED